MATNEPNAEKEEALRRRLREFNRRTRQRAAVLTGRQEIARSDDPLEILQQPLNNWTDQERLLVKHGAFYPLIDKVRRIRNSVVQHTGAFT